MIFQKQLPEVFYEKKVFLEISQNSQENTFFTEQLDDCFWSQLHIFCSAVTCLQLNNKFVWALQKWWLKIVIKYWPSSKKYSSSWSRVLRQSFKYSNFKYNYWHCTKNEEILNGKLHFLCSVSSSYQRWDWKSHIFKAVDFVTLGKQHDI